MFPTTYHIYSEKGWFSTAELEARKTTLKLQYPDTSSNGVGSKYIIRHNMASPLIPTLSIKTGSYSGFFYFIKYLQ